MMALRKGTTVRVFTRNGYDWTDRCSLPPATSAARA